jgi:rhombotail lipoprotein
MKMQALIAGLGACAVLSGCTLVQHAYCTPNCTTQQHHSSSLVSFLYPDGKAVPPGNTVPELHLPLRVGLAFLPSQAALGPSPIDAAQKQELLERIRQRFASRKFVGEIVIVPDYYLANERGFTGLEGVQRLYNIDVMALVSYDQVTHTDDNKLSLGYLTIVGAYFLPGSSQSATTLVDLAVVDPATRSLILRAGGTSSSHGTSTLVDADRNARKASADGFAAATDQMIENFDAALTTFENDVHEGKAHVKIVHPSASRGGGGGGAAGPWDLLGLLGLATLPVARRVLPAHNAGAEEESLA